MQKQTRTTRVKRHLRTPPRLTQLEQPERRRSCARRRYMPRCLPFVAGEISPEELHAALSKRLGEGASGLVSKTMINIADEDENGMISREELQNLVRRLVKTEVPDWENRHSSRATLVRGTTLRDTAGR